jgi:hypothetical protein
LFHFLDRNNGTHALIFYCYANFIHDFVFNGFWWSLLKIAVNGLEWEEEEEEEDGKVEAGGKKNKRKDKKQ